MSLKIVYGKAGSGKSKYIFDEINKKIKNEEKEKIFIITPEQFSYTAEKKLMETNSAVINAEVITFDRMSYRILNETGGIINNNLTKCGKSMLIYSILKQESKKLKLLNKSDENIDLCGREISEFKKNNILVSDLKKEFENIKDDYLKIKLKDMILIYEKFQEKIENKYIDETDKLTYLYQNIEKSDLFKNALVYIDEFVGYTKQELEIIKKLLNISKQLTITFCLDNLELKTNPDQDIFYPNKKTLSKILQLLKDNEKLETINLDKLYRFKNEELLFIEKNLYNNKKNIYEKEVKNINLFLAKNKYSEIEYIAKKIVELIKTNNYKYNEIGIITKNVGEYSSLIKAIFTKYEIPAFIDEKKDLNQNLFVRYVLSIIEIIIKNYSYESVFNYLKNGFSEFSEEDIFKFEKYCIKYGVKNNKFKNDFIYGNDKIEIEYLNELRKKIINPISNLENKINKKQNIENLIKEIYLFLENENIEQKIQKINSELIKEYKLSYEIVINIFDEIINIFKNEKIKLEEFYKIFMVGLKNSNIGKIPLKQDFVTVGDTERSRAHKLKAVFIIGLNDGVYPSVNKNEGFFNDQDREKLKQTGLEIAKGTIENLYDDNFNIYKAFTTAEEKIFLSYCQTDINGKSLRRSNLVLKLKKMFIYLKEESDILKINNYFISERDLYENLILNINYLNNNNKNIFLFYKYFKNSEKYKNKLSNNIEYIKLLKAPSKTKKENVLKLYGNKIVTSVSKLETFKSCPYEYFLQYSLKLREREEFKIKNLDTGTFMHDVINLFFEEIKNKKISIKNMDEEDANKIINKIIEEKLKENKNYIFTATPKYKFLVKRLKRIISKAIKYIIYSLQSSKFDVLGTEISFDEKKGTYKPITLDLENGKKVEIIGKIDRVDIANDGDNKIIRIIDYKSSVKDLDFTNIFGGLQLQLITYLDAMVKIEDFIPAGILYFNLLEQVINSEKKLNDEEIEEKIKSNFKMKGLILADVKIAKMQDSNLYPSTSSKIIPAYLDKEGNLSPKKSSIATKEEFEKLQQYVNKTIKEISEEILNGNIELKPYYKNKNTPCEYCTYKNICEFNSGIYKTEYRFINKKTKEEFFEEIK